MNYPFDTTRVDSGSIDALFETYQLLKGKYDVEITGNIDFRLPDFEVFRKDANPTINGSYVIKNALTHCYILFVELRDTAGVGKSYKYAERFEYQTWALAYLKKDFGRTLTRRETLADKIIELVHPVELDFADDKGFSDSFYVLTNDRWKAEAAMDRNFRNVVMDMRHEDILIETIGHTLIVGYNQPVMPESSILLADFVVRLCSNC